jgi:flagellar biosynthesis component FlhA
MVDLLGVQGTKRWHVPRRSSRGTAGFETALPDVPNMTGGEFAGIAAAVVAGSLGLAVLVQRRGDDEDRRAPRQLRRMYLVGRAVFSVLGIALVVVGLALDTPVVVLAGIASLLAALGQHWASRTTTGR